MEVTFIDSMGDDLRVVNAARVSFAKTSKWIFGSWDDYNAQPEAWQYNSQKDACTGNFRRLSEGDTKLIRYLARHAHWTPFAHVALTFRISAPIFVARQLYKHVVGLAVTDDDEARTIERGLHMLALALEDAQDPITNEVSRRYVDAAPELYVPTQWRNRAENVKQGSSEDTLEGAADTKVKTNYGDALVKSLEVYYELLDTGVCPEQARMVLPQSMYTEWYWTGSLAAFARVCSLRLDPHSQKETRQIAEKISEHCGALAPVSWGSLIPSK